jgi:hypothetical protein
MEVPKKEKCRFFKEKEQKCFFSNGNCLNGNEELCKTTAHYQMMLKVWEKFDIIDINLDKLFDTVTNLLRTKSRDKRLEARDYILGVGNKGIELLDKIRKDIIELWSHELTGDNESTNKWLLHLYILLNLLESVDIQLCETCIAYPEKLKLINEEKLPPLCLKCNIINKTNDSLMWMSALKDRRFISLNV